MTIAPPPGLLDKVAERVRDELKRRTFPPDPITGLGGMGLTEHDIARAAWDAVAEGLGLFEEVHPFPVVGQRPRTAQDSGLVLDDTPVSVIERWTVARRLVSKWEPQP